MSAFIELSIMVKKKKNTIHFLFLLDIYKIY